MKNVSKPFKKGRILSKVKEMGRNKPKSKKKNKIK